MKKTILLLGACAIGMASPAFAASADAKKADEMTKYYFYKMDTDHNGYVSRAEHDAFAADMFNKADTNRDGFLTYNEIVAHKQSEWDDFDAHYKNRTGATFDGDKYYPYGKGSPTLTPNEPFKANRDKNDRFRDYDIRNDNDSTKN